MPALSASTDFVEELMFRCWARRNYLPRELRERDWHPIILEEMAMRDQELVEQAERDAWLNRTPNPSFVPLVPTMTHIVHPAQAEIREPHFLSVGSSSANLCAECIYAGGVYEFQF